MRKVWMVPCIFALAAAFSWADDMNVTGKWEITTSSQRGDRTSPIEFVQSGQDLKITMQSRQGGTVEATGKIDGDKIEWSVTQETQRGTFTRTYVGKVSEDHMEGEVEFGSMGSGKWTAKRLSGE